MVKKILEQKNIFLNYYNNFLISFIKICASLLQLLKIAIVICLFKYVSKQLLDVCKKPQ